MELPDAISSELWTGFIAGDNISGMMIGSFFSGLFQLQLQVFLEIQKNVRFLSQILPSIFFSVFIGKRWPQTTSHNTGTVQPPIPTSFPHLLHTFPLLRMKTMKTASTIQDLREEGCMG